jgi:pSer/pThr/pTyr-binding forkhead associated (FHA) protein
MRSAQKFKRTDLNAPLARQPNEVARFKVVNGPDYGCVFVIHGTSATIGRGDESDVVILDLKASRLHAELKADPSGWIIKDRGSANGIIYNGQSVRQSPMRLGDTITIGETTLEFTTADAQTRMIMAPPRSFDQVIAEGKNRASVQGALLGTSGQSQASGLKGLDASKIRTGLLSAAVLVGAYFTLGQEKSPSTQSQGGEKSAFNSNSNSYANLASYLPQVEYNKDAETMFKDGLREYLNGNYTRARIQFETVVQILPSHELANLYLQNCTKSINDEVKFNLEYGKKSLQAGKLKDAKSHYERILRFLYKDQSNPAYVESKDQYEKVVKMIQGNVPVNGVTQDLPRNDQGS